MTSVLGSGLGLHYREAPASLKRPERGAPPFVCLIPGRGVVLSVSTARQEPRDSCVPGRSLGRRSKGITASWVHTAAHHQPKAALSPAPRSSRRSPYPPSLASASRN